MADAYLLLLRAPKEKIQGKVFNAGYENQTVLELAKTVKDVIGEDVNVVLSETDDNRSYHISSDKFQKELGFSAKHSIKEAIEELKEAFEEGLLEDPLENEKYFNLKRMQSINLK